MSDAKSDGIFEIFVVFLVEPPLSCLFVMPPPAHASGRKKSSQPKQGSFSPLFQGSRQNTGTRKSATNGKKYVFARSFVMIYNRFALDQRSEDHLSILAGTFVIFRRRARDGNILHTFNVNTNMPVWQTVDIILV